MTLLYDGTSAVPREGSLSAGPARVTFTPSHDQGEIFTFSYDQIVRIDYYRSHVTIRVALSGSNEGSIETHRGDSEIEKIEKEWKKTKNTLFNLVHSFDRMRWKKVLGITLTGILLIGAFYITMAYNAYRFLPETVDSILGARMTRHIWQIGKPCNDPQATEKLHDLSALLKNPDSPFTYTITIIENSQGNALALPGGYIYIFTGLMETVESYEELAAVLAHEMAHVEKRHGMQQLSRYAALRLGSSLFLEGFTGGLDMIEALGDTTILYFLLHYSRAHELEADREAARAMQRAGLDSEKLARFLGRIEETWSIEEEGSLLERIPEHWSTHPDFSERIEAIEALSSRRAISSSRMVPSYIHDAPIIPSCEKKE